MCAKDGPFMYGFSPRNQPSVEIKRQKKTKLYTEDVFLKMLSKIFKIQKHFEINILEIKKL